MTFTKGKGKMSYELNDGFFESVGKDYMSCVSGWLNDDVNKKLKIFFIDPNYFSTSMFSLNSHMNSS